MAMATSSVVMERQDEEQELSPRQPAPSVEQTIQSLGSMGNRLESLDNLRADPDAQATVTDFLDFTEYLPADMTRSLTLIGKLDQNYIEASSKVHELTKQWGQLPNMPSDDRPAPVQLRKEISQNLSHALNSRVYSFAEAKRMAENTARHYKRVSTIIAKMEAMLENYPSAEVQKSPVAATKSSQATRSQRITLRVGDHQKVRAPRVPRITVPGEVLAPYDMEYEMVGTDESSSEDEEEDDETTPDGTTPAPSTQRARLPKAPKAPKTPKPPKVPKKPKNQQSAPLHPALTQPVPPVSSLKPPPADAVIGSEDAPWLQLTQWELAKLRKRMKKNAQWVPSETMIARELKALGRGPEGFRRAKQDAEDQGQSFNPHLPTPIADDDGVLHPPLGALSLDLAQAVEDKQSKNRGLKLNVAKRIKKENLARLAAEEAEESARKMLQTANELFPAALEKQPVVEKQPAEASSSGKNAGKTPKIRKRKRDSAPEGDAEKPEVAGASATVAGGNATGASAAAGEARPQIKRMKTETPVPLPSSQSQTQIPPPQLGHAHSTTPIPVPIPGQDQHSVPGSAVDSSSGSPMTATTTVTTTVPVKPPAELAPPLQSPKKSTTPILPPVRETRKSQAIKKEQQQQQQQKDTQLAVQATTQTVTVPTKSGSPLSSTPGASSSSTSAAAAAATTTEATRRPASRGKAASQEPQPTLASDRARRASTARNTPAPEPKQQGAGSGSGSSGGGSRRGKRPAPGVISRTNSGGSSAVGKRKAAPRKKSRSASMAKKDKDKDAEAEVEVDDEGNVIDPDEERYCLCNGVSYGLMIQCDNIDNCPYEWFHVDCVDLGESQPARTTKWYCPTCRVTLNIGEKGEVNARGVKA